MLHLSLVLVLGTFCTVFQLCEYSKGLDSTVPNHEAYQSMLDSVRMLVILVLPNVIHPGQLMPGKGSDLPSLHKGWPCSSACLIEQEDTTGKPEQMFGYGN